MCDEIKNHCSKGRKAPDAALVPLAVVTPWFSREAWALARAGRTGGGWARGHLARMAALARAVDEARAAGRQVEILATTALPADAPWPGPAGPGPAALCPGAPADEELLRDVPPERAGESPAGPAEQEAPAWQRDAFPEDVIPLGPGLTVRRFAAAPGDDGLCAFLAARAAAAPLSGTQAATLALNSLHSPRLYGYLHSRPGLQVQCLPADIPLARFALAAHRRGGGA